MNQTELVRKWLQKGTEDRIFKLAEEIILKKRVPKPNRMTFDYALHIILNEV